MSIRRVDLGTVVKSWYNRTGIEFDGVVIEIVPPQKFPRSGIRGNLCLDYRTRYVIRADAGAFIRSLDQIEVIAL